MFAYMFYAVESTYTCTLDAVMIELNYFYVPKDIYELNFLVRYLLKFD